MTEIRELTLADRDTITSHLQRFPTVISEHTFTNLFAWRHFRKIYYLQLEDTIAFITKDPAKKDSLTLFGPPVGVLSLNDMIDILGDSFGGAIRIPSSAVVDLNSNKLFIIEDGDNADYVYKVNDLASLQGRKYSKKRNLIKQCLQQHTPSYEPITHLNRAECMTMQDRWCEHRQCDRDISLCGELQAIQDSFHYFDELKLQGGAIRINGTIEAFAIGEQLHPGTGVCHFEKASPGFTGLGQFINNQFTRNSMQGFTYINREQDLGIQGIRKAKESYHPDHMVMKHTIGTPSQFTWQPGCVSDSEQ